MSIIRISNAAAMKFLVYQQKQGNLQLFLLHNIRTFFLEMAFRSLLRIHIDGRTDTLLFFHKEHCFFHKDKTILAVQH